MANNNIISVGICEGRHTMPVSNFIFNQEVNPLDVEKLEVVAKERLEAFAKEANAERNTCLVPETYEVYTYPGDENICETVYSAEIRLYVTGLTVAVIAAVKAAVRLFKRVTLLHYDRESGTYYEQLVK